MHPAFESILAAHGGERLWADLESIELEMSAWGFLFTAKRVAPRPRLRVSMAVQRMVVTLHDYPAPGQYTVLLPDSTVQWWSAHGTLVQQRATPRTQFHRLRHQLYWDELDFAYFCSYAMWNYMTLPWLLARSGALVLSQSDLPRSGGHSVRVQMPADVVTHCPVQTFRFDPQWRLLRHDYTAQVVGQWARAAHLCGQYQEFFGLPMPTRRRVLPTLGGWVTLPGPTLVGLDIHDVRLTSVPTSAAAR